jgi:hypothetical protein
MDREQAKMDWEKAKADTQVCYEAYKRSQERFRLAHQTYMTANTGVRPGDIFEVSNKSDELPQRWALIEWLYTSTGGMRALARKATKTGWSKTVRTVHIFVDMGDILKRVEG